MAAHFGNSALMGWASLSLCPHSEAQSSELPGETDMGAIPAQRESVAHGADTHALAPVRVRATFPGTPLTPGAARALLRATLSEWAELALPGTEFLTPRQSDDAVVVVSELVTNAVVHAGTEVELDGRLEAHTGALVIEVLDHHPSRAPRDGDTETPYGIPEYGRGLRLVAALAESWGITYRTGAKTVWALSLIHI